MDKLIILLIGFALLKPELNEGGSSKERKRIVQKAESLLNSKYSYGGRGPDRFDCSGFTAYVFKTSAGIKLNRSSQDQSRQGKAVKLEDCKPGDLIFFGSKNRINHVAIIHKRKGSQIWMIHASSSKGVISEEIMRSHYWRSRIVKLRSIF